MKNHYLIIFFLVFVSHLDIYGQDSLKTKFPFFIHAGSGVGFNTLNSNQAKDELAHLVSTSFRIGIESEISKGWLVGLTIYRNEFLVSKASGNYGENGGAGFFVNRIFQPNARQSFYGSIGLGYSGLVFENYMNASMINSKGKSSGVYACFGIGYRKIYDSGFGIFAQLDNSIYRYFSLRIEPDDGPKEEIAKWKMEIQSLDLRVGLLYGFDKKKQ